MQIQKVFGHLIEFGTDELRGLIATEKWRKRLVKLGKETTNEELRQHLLARCTLWCETYLHKKEYPFFPGDSSLPVMQS